MKIANIVFQIRQTLVICIQVGEKWNYIKGSISRFNLI